MKTIHDVSSYWGSLRGDARMLDNAAYIKERFLDKGLQGALGGEGFYRYPNPAYAAAGFLAVPPRSAVPDLVARVMPK
jgi:3-hydroxybutyryl-CoA dehydrogenase